MSPHQNGLWCLGFYFQIGLSSFYECFTSSYCKPPRQLSLPQSFIFVTVTSNFAVPKLISAVHWSLWCPGRERKSYPRSECLRPASCQPNSKPSNMSAENEGRENEAHGLCIMLCETHRPFWTCMLCVSHTTPPTVKQEVSVWNGDSHDLSTVMMSRNVQTTSLQLFKNAFSECLLIQNA